MEVHIYFEKEGGSNFTSVFFVVKWIPANGTA